MNYAATLLSFVRSELEANYNDCDLLDEVVAEVEKYNYKIEDLWYDNEELKETV